MLLTFFVLLGAIAYLQVGYYVGVISLKTWLAKDNRSRRSFLLFPVSFCNGCVGQDSKNVLSLFDFESKSGSDTAGPLCYKLCVAVVWPAKLIINAPAIMLYRALGRFKGGWIPAAEPEAERLLPAPDDDVQTLFEKRQAIVDEILSLSERKKQIDDEILRRKSEMDAVIEMESDADLDVKRLFASPSSSATKE